MAEQVARDADLVGRRESPGRCRRIASVVRRDANTRRSVVWRVMTGPSAE